MSKIVTATRTEIDAAKLIVERNEAKGKPVPWEIRRLATASPGEALIDYTSARYDPVLEAGAGALRNNISDCYCEKGKPECPNCYDVAEDVITVTRPLIEKECADAQADLMRVLGIALANYENLVKVLEKLKLDTPEDQELHNRVLNTHRSTIATVKSLLHKDSSDV